MKLLLVHDSAELPASLELAFRDASLTVSSASLHEDGIELARRYEYDVIVLDLHAPDLKGHTFLRSIRDSRVTTPVLIVSHMNETKTVVRGLELGADDYVTKPIPVSELLARIQAIVRRSKGQASSTFAVGKLTIDIFTQKISVGTKAVSVSNTQYRILELFCLRPDQLVTKDMVLDHLYGGQIEPTAKAVDVMMHRLRKKLAEATDGEQVIATIRGLGYFLVNNDDP